MPLKNMFFSMITLYSGRLIIFSSIVATSLGFADNAMHPNNLHNEYYVRPKTRSQSNWQLVFASHRLQHRSQTVHSPSELTKGGCVNMTANTDKLVIQLTYLTSSCTTNAFVTDRHVNERRMTANPDNTPILIPPAMLRAVILKYGYKAAETLSGDANIIDIHTHGLSGRWLWRCLSA